MPTPEGPVFDGACASSQAAKSSVACFAFATSALRSAGSPSSCAASCAEVGALLADALRAVDPEVAAVARSGWSSPARGAPGSPRSPASHLRGAAPARAETGRSRARRRPDGERALARGLVALLREDRDVEGRVVGPGLQDAVIEVEAVHLRAHDVVVHLLRRWASRAGRSRRGAAGRRRARAAAPPSRPRRSPARRRRASVSGRRASRGRRRPGLRASRPGAPRADPASRETTIHRTAGSL